jgi:2-keto-3-deoxy-6-phosphogluconate aldolase
MTGKKRIEVINALYDRALIVRLKDAALNDALAMASTQLDGGAKLVELSPAQDGDLQMALNLAARAKQAEPELILGVGPVSAAAQARTLLDGGLDFISGPFDPGVAKACNRAGVMYLPGVAGQAEASAAAELGLEFMRAPSNQPNGLAGFAATNPGISLVSGLLDDAARIEPCLQDGASAVTCPAAADAAGAADLVWAAAGARGLPCSPGWSTPAPIPWRARMRRRLCDGTRITWVLSALRVRGIFSPSPKDRGA